MVQIAPPPGWTPAVAPAPEPAASGPPPLDRVAAEPSMLDLEPAGGSWFGAIFRGNVWLLAAVVLTFVLLGVCLLWLAVDASGEPEPVAVATERPAAAAKRTEADRASSPGSQSAGVQRAANAAGNAASSGSAAVNIGIAAAGNTAAAAAISTAEAKPAKSRSTAVGCGSGRRSRRRKKRTEAKQEAKQPETKKLPPAAVDVAARMADALPGIELTDLPLARAVDLLAAVSTLPITLDPDAMRQLGVSPRDPISLRLDSTTIGQALQAVAAKRGLAVTVDNGQVILTLPAEERETLRTVPYTVSDLTGDDKAAVAEFAALVRRFVAPESWREAGGRGTVEPKERSADGDANPRRSLAGAGVLRKASQRQEQAAAQPRSARAVHADDAHEPSPGDARSAGVGQFSRARAAGQDPRLPGQGDRQRYSDRPCGVGGGRDVGSRRDLADGAEAAVGGRLGRACSARWGWRIGRSVPMRSK